MILPAENSGLLRPFLRPIRLCFPLEGVTSALSTAPERHHNTNTSPDNDFFDNVHWKYDYTSLDGHSHQPTFDHIPINHCPTLEPSSP